jgi:trans-aconitate methyltransferase
MAKLGAGPADHWDEAYAHGDVTRSWYQARAVQSVRMLERCSVGPQDSIIDVGGGASIFVDALLERGHTDVTVLDISAAGLLTAQQRLGSDSERVHWEVADLLAWQPTRTYRVWHDRAVFHFLITEDARRRYLQNLVAATASGAAAIFAVFAIDGPQYCSGLPVARYRARHLADTLGERWMIIAEDREEHPTPSGAVQPLTWAAFRRR